MLKNKSFLMAIAALICLTIIIYSCGSGGDSPQVQNSSGAADGTDQPTLAMDDDIRSLISSLEANGWPDTGGPINYYLPYSNNTHMGITQGTKAGGHAGRLAGSVDFNIAGSDYESSNNIAAVASATGKVVHAGYKNGYGNTVVIHHPDGNYSLYAHLDSISVSNDQNVCSGQKVGIIGTTGYSTGDHLHFEIRNKSQAILMPSFSELPDVPSSMNPCTTSTWTNGCYGSINIDLSTTGGCGQTTPNEVCNGVDDDGNGRVDDNPACWLAVYRFIDRATGARCWNKDSKPGSECSNYEYEIEAWVSPSTNIPGTFRLMQCSRGTDHILVENNSADYNTLRTNGYSCDRDLGFVWRAGQGLYSTPTPFGTSHKVYRFRYDAGGTGAHLFSRGADDLSGMTCESPSRFEIVTTDSYFSGTPNGCSN